MLTLDQPQLQTHSGVAPSPPHRVAPAPSPSAPATAQASKVSPHFVSPSLRLSISSLLLDPESDPRDIAHNHNLPLDTILDIFESEDFQHRLQRIERMQQRRAEFHLSTTKPLAARNLALILEASLAEELTCTNRDTPEASTLRCRARETTRKICNNILGRSALGRSALRADRAAPKKQIAPKNTQNRATDMSSCRCPPSNHLTRRAEARSILSANASSPKAVLNRPSKQGADPQTHQPAPAPESRPGTRAISSRCTNPGAQPVPEVAKVCQPAIRVVGRTDGDCHRDRCGPLAGRTRASKCEADALRLHRAGRVHGHPGHLESRRNAPPQADQTGLPPALRRVPL